MTSTSLGGSFLPAASYAMTGTITGPVPTRTLTVASAIPASESGTTYVLSATAEFETTRPPPAPGLKFSFVVGAAPSSASYTIVPYNSADIFVGLQVNAAGDAGDTSTGDDVITFVDGQAVAGDRVDLLSDGQSWFCWAFCKVAAGITFT